MGTCARGQVETAGLPCIGIVPQGPAEQRLPIDRGRPDVSFLTPGGRISQGGIGGQSAQYADRHSTVRGTG